MQAPRNHYAADFAHYHWQIHRMDPSSGQFQASLKRVSYPNDPTCTETQVLMQLDCLEDLNKAAHQLIHREWRDPSNHLQERSLIELTDGQPTGKMAVLQAFNCLGVFNPRNNLKAHWDQCPSYSFDYARDANNDFALEAYTYFGHPLFSLPVHDLAVAPDIDDPTDIKRLTPALRQHLEPLGLGDCAYAVTRKQAYHNRNQFIHHGQDIGAAAFKALALENDAAEIQRNNLEVWLEIPKKPDGNFAHYPVACIGEKSPVGDVATEALVQLEADDTAHVINDVHRVAAECHLPVNQALAALVKPYVEDLLMAPAGAPEPI